MKKKTMLSLTAFALLMMGAPASTFAHGADSDHHHAYEEIHADKIKEMLDAKETVIILDARTKDYDDGNRLPGAKFLPYNSSDEAIEAAVPSKESMIIIYCTNPKCPASKFLAERMSTMGYTNLFKYPEGINDWIQKGYPVDHAK